MCVCSCPAGEVEAGGVAVELILAEVDLPQRPPDAPREVAPADKLILYYIILYYVSGTSADFIYHIAQISYIISRTQYFIHHIAHTNITHNII